VSTRSVITSIGRTNTFGTTDNTLYYTGWRYVALCTFNPKYSVCAHGLDRPWRKRDDETVGELDKNASSRWTSPSARGESRTSEHFPPANDGRRKSIIIKRAHVAAPFVHARESYDTRARWQTVKINEKFARSRARMYIVELPHLELCVAVGFHDERAKHRRWCTPRLAVSGAGRTVVVNPTRPDGNTRFVRSIALQRTDRRAEDTTVGTATICRRLGSPIRPGTPGDTSPVYNFGPGRPIRPVFPKTFFTQRPSWCSKIAHRPTD